MIAIVHVFWAETGNIRDAGFTYVFKRSRGKAFLGFFDTEIRAVSPVSGGVQTGCCGASCGAELGRVGWVIFNRLASLARARLKS
jgi:hypothetical protein